MNILCGIIVFLPAVVGNCPDGWLWTSATCYHFSDEEQAMASATYMCKVLGGHLVNIEDGLKESFLKKVAAFYGHDYWVGLNNIQDGSEWMWLHSMKTLNDTQFENWYPGQPDNAGKSEHCVIIDSSNSGQWFDRDCTDTNRYICEMVDPSV